VKPGWYSHVHDRNVAAYFDGLGWGPLADTRHLDPQIQRTIEPLLPGHGGPAAPFETIRNTEKQKAPKTPWWYWTNIAGGVLALVGFLIGYNPISKDCGSPFAPNTKLAALRNAVRSDAGLPPAPNPCTDTLWPMSMWAMTLIAAGVLLIFVTVVIWLTIKPSKSSVAARV
jgi:hypothetical protein